ncbi:MAG TPA: ABC transporter ATP-binding protein, partial [Chloroflexi bacterium]|nr:ABC transporter ATP-binding protein [Chloroflexota bacterium]
MKHNGTAIDIRNVVFRYTEDAPPALDGICAQIPVGGITTILGPNGSGKSTLMHILLGLLRPQMGKIYLLGREQKSYTRRELSHLVGLVPQEEHVTFELNVFEYALLGRAPYLGMLALPGDDDRSAAYRALESIGIDTLAHRPVPSLSGGERQLATVARALTQDPQVLLLDEPTSHLDLANARRILTILDVLKRGGRTIVCTTHDPNAAAAIADHVLLMRGGRVIAQGSVESVITSEQLSATYGVP